MIARIVIPLLLLIVLSDVFIDAHLFRKRFPLVWWKRLLWWIPTLVMVSYTCILASLDSFAPDEMQWLTTYLVLLGIIVGPKIIFSLCTIAGMTVRRYLIPTKRNYGYPLAAVLSITAVGLYIYGLTIGVGEIKVKHITLSFPNLPLAYDGYRIVHVSDLHLGSFKGWRERILKAEMDSIRAQEADQIIFTGDLQNMRPEEVNDFIPLLKKAMPRTITILGNHDYAEYVKLSSEEAAEQEQRFKNIVRNKLGWTLLDNKNTILPLPKHNPTNDNTPIIICGGENDGRPPFPKKVDMAQTMQCVKSTDFVIMLQHDPSAWRRNILPHTHAQLTLSGHTHGGQMQFFGFRPTQIRQKEDLGLYQENGRYLYITAGLGGLVPFRLNMPNEVTVITLRKAVH
ncbi:metallophosphoesterase [Prevotella ihumii]|uniref:metallophosphoesterase n=1 Tax=Prevotella ihumii TaxID=1917878 RepID=UPI0009811662|nr:metallophosphoesterase [Prevotella ihumii]